MWLLLLNDMRASNIENLDPVGRAETKQELIEFLNREKVEPYRDGQWAKCYKVGGPLEWKNPPWNFDDGEHFIDVGDREDWIQQASDNFDSRVMSVMYV